jgi:hypothetical protein
MVKNLTLVLNYFTGRTAIPVYKANRQTFVSFIHGYKWD